MGRPRSFDDEKVISDAMDAFWTHGYAATSPAKLAEATGIAKGSLYNAFASKRDLFDRCLTLYQDQMMRMAQELLEHPGTTKECLRAALRTIVDNDLAQAHPRGCLIGNTAVELAGQDPALAGKLRLMQDESTGWFAARIQTGQLKGDLSPDHDAQALAEHLATTLAGLRVMAMTHDAPSLHRVIDTALAVL
ncbi:TetR/AcrR family transcriptional repressor of nem operon [Paenarthrobacter nicotinovorans]|uniref:TetR/AcrR family transcriptional regulator n=1 Tax=Micrococcaceae TaxID=1268 RepID=UPI0008770006|nr:MULTISPECIES: TetR/AcrR family transcriptional regulator [Micrococcaceae]MDR6437700.1 TetR/AcrR family transcriptional repressor of nem operon [Paenarthrobacter nicotinovorans]SCZ61199.1 transcriptional regulator, TetR family [Arthrobacter sp. UNCCL28]